MKLQLICFFIFFVLFEARTEYTAAVVEFFPEQDQNLEPADRLRKNVDNYIHILARINQRNKLDIIVYPESTIATNAIITDHIGVLPYAIDVEINGTNLCNTERNTTFITPLACAAVKYNTYIVVNIYEKAICQTRCRSDGWDFFNTNIVFNRNGTIISKYRKYNLFGEALMSVTEKPDMSKFSTDFNVTFGMFICFDILFKKPALDLIIKENITSVVYPAMWFSELPFLTALQTQLQWSYALNTTLLAAGANNLVVGSGGSGIFQGTTGALSYSILGTNNSAYFISNLPQPSSDEPDWNNVNTIDRKAKQMDGFYFKTDNLSPYSSKLILQNESEISETVCSQADGIDFCCNFTISVKWNKEILNDNKNHYQYHMVAFSGVRSFDGVYNGGVEICGIVACVNNTVETCGKRFPDYSNISWPATFTKIVIESEFDLEENKIQFPNSLLSNIKPIHVNAIEWKSTTNEKKIKRVFTLKETVYRLMTFSIYGRDFTRDSPVSTGGGTASINDLSVYCFILLILNFRQLYY